MNVRYFFVADVQKRNHITITHCPTDEMIGDFFTKPVGGAKYRRFRNIIMNISQDEYGPVDVDALTTLHNEKLHKKSEMEASHCNDEPTISKSSHVTNHMADDTGSKEIKTADSRTGGPRKEDRRPKHKLHHGSGM